MGKRQKVDEYIIRVPKQGKRRACYYCRESSTPLPFTYQKSKASKFTDISELIMKCVELDFTLGIPTIWMEI